MTTRKLTCIVCPRGCRLEVQVNSGTDVAEPQITGCACEKGRKWAFQEVFSPERVLTSNVVIDGSDFELISVKSNRPLPFEALTRALEEIKAMKLHAPVKIGDVIIKGVAGTDIYIIATRNS